MPPRLEAPVLTVDAGKMHQIDTRNVENLHSMWTVFNRCAEAMEEGRRLENLSWRIWNRETFCCDQRNHTVSDIDPDRLRPRQQSSRDLPPLSTSVDSVVSDDIESRMARSRQNISCPLAIKQLSSSRSSLSGLVGSARERHISSFALERMVISIKERKNPKEALPAHVVEAIPRAAASAPAAVHTNTHTHPLPTSLSHTAQEAASSSTVCPPMATLSSSRRHDEARSSRSSDSTAPLSSTSSRGSRRMDSDTSADSMLLPPNPHNVVRGFAPGQPSSYKASPRPSAPIPAKSMANDAKKGMFVLGGSKSSNEEDSSLDTRMSASRPGPQKSSLTSQFKRESLAKPKKTTSFRDIVETRAIADEDVFESSSDEEDDDAIEDDGDSDAIEEDEDDGEWEDSASESEDDERPPMFKRIDSKVNLTSRRSLLTTGIHESDRAAGLLDSATAAQLPPSVSQPTLQQTGRTRSSRQAPQSSLSNLHNEQRSLPKPIPISPSNNALAIALSPKTTRRNMLAHELTESLRMHLLHERAMKSQVNNASRRGIERRHTAQGNLSQLRAYPSTNRHDRNEWIHANPEDEDENEVWENGVFGSAGEYHERGW